MSKYRKRPVVIEAIQLPFHGSKTPSWIMDDSAIILKRMDGLILEAIISTLEGVMTASRGDWIIKGVKGELYPCKPDIFAETYEPVE